MAQSQLSVVVPTYNESANIAQLLSRIDRSLRSVCEYEILVIDDHSTDATQRVVLDLVDSYPVRFILKPDTLPKGKAESLMYGFSLARYALIAMIDGDLQYPPEALPDMLACIHHGADVVVANRVDSELGYLRKSMSFVFRYFFAYLLHGFTCDVQSGLKMFRTEIVERISIQPTRWTFDLEFLICARDAGYSIQTVDIHFHKRIAGKTNIHFLRSSYEIALHALRMRFRDAPVIPLHSSECMHGGYGFHYKGVLYVHYASLPFVESALVILTFRQKVILLVVLLGILVGFVFHFHWTLIVLVGFLSFLYFADLLFNFYLIYKSFTRPQEIVITHEMISRMPDSSLPVYTILCPLYKEWEVLPQFVSAMSQLDYPKSQLQVMLLLEENDTETIAHARAFDLPSYFEIIIVPHSLPKTKPKACNYGLLHAKGEYIVIYDAEDIPDPLQLKKAVCAFSTVDSRVKCVQAKLNYYNPRQNVLTRFFTAEYSLWFDLILSGLQSLNTLIPLGGTSNHFRTADLRMMHGWDAFNVTEDCDLGIRMVKQGYKTALMDSTTLEEANSAYVNWLLQRSRWIKGYIVSYFVHMRNPRSFIANGSWKHLLALQLVVGGKVLSLFINPILWIVTISYFAFRSTLGPAIQSVYPGLVFYFAVISLVCGNFLYIYIYMIGLAKRQYWDLIKYVYFVPFYWLSMSIAGWIALYKLIVAPHHWAKTKHGLHLSNSRVVAEAKLSIGRDLVDDSFAGNHGIVSPHRL